MLPFTLASPETYRAAAFEALKPDPRETISEWADQFMRLPSVSSESGRWRTSRFPFMREIMDCLSPSDPHREVVFMKPVQISGTSVGVCWMGYTIHRVPCNMLVVEPTVDLGKKLSRQRIDPMIDLVPEVSERVSVRRSRDTGNTTFEKEFMGGRIVITGANSGVGLRFMSAKHLMLDEVDGYPADVDGEGDPVSKAEKRVATFPNHKIFKLSTPKKKDTSVIEREYLSSDQRRYHVPCPFCDHGQVLSWEGLTWKQGKPETAEYLCEQCQHLIPEFRKTDFLSRGQWMTQLTERDWTFTARRKAGFHINLLYQPYGFVHSWPYLAAEWTDIAHSKNRERLQTFINDYWAETWEESLGEKLDYKELWNRREIYPAPVPTEAKVITAFVDTQDDRLEGEIRAWGPGRESWGLGYRVFLGSPGDKSPDGVWAKLDEWLQQTFPHPSSGNMGITMAGIDSGGHFTQEVYDFVRPRQSRGILATKGSSQRGAHLLAGRHKQKEAGIWLHHIGTDSAKDNIFANLKLTDPGPGYLHWPNLIAYDEEYFQQVCSECKVPIKSRGRTVGSKYMKLRDRNEALDILVGNWFIVAMTGVDLNQFQFDYRDAHPNTEQRAVQAQRGDWINRQAPRGSRQRGGWLRR